MKIIILVIVLKLTTRWKKINKTKTVFTGKTILTEIPVRIQQI